MEQSNTRKAVYLGISLIVSLLIWFAVSGNAEVSIDVADVPVEFLNEATSLAEKGLMRIDTEVPTVDLTLRTTRSNVYKLDTDEIRLLADLGSVTAPGAQSINYSISFPPNVASSEVKIEYPAARTVLVNIGELFRKEVDVRCEVVGSVAEGYLAESVRLTPKTIEIRGQQEDIVNVNYAQVTLDVSDAKATMVELLEFELYDFNDQKIESALIYPAVDSIQAVMPVKRVKELPIRIELIEAPGVRAENVKATLSTESVTLSGDAALLDGLEEITPGSVNLADYDGRKTFTYPLEIPEELENLSGINEVMLTLEYQGITTTLVNAVRFEVASLSEGQQASVITGSLPVTLRGTVQELGSVTVEDIIVTADLSDISATAGVYTAPAAVYVDGDADVGVVGEYEVTVRIEDAAEEG